MSDLQITHTFVKKLTRNLRALYGEGPRHTQVLETIAVSLDRRAGPLMHALKHAAILEDGGEADTAETPPAATFDPAALIAAIKANDADVAALLADKAVAGILREALDRHLPKPAPDARVPGGPKPMVVLDWLYARGVEQKDDIIDTDVLFPALEAQLGRPWFGFRDATPACRAILVLLALRCLAKGSERESPSLPETRHFGPLSVSDAEAAMKELLRRHETNPAIAKLVNGIAKKHAYETTVVQAMAAEVLRRGEPLDPQQMVRFRELDRNLWFALANADRTKFQIEAAGIVSHFQAERVIRKPLLKPYLHPAAEGVETYLSDAGRASVSA